MTIQQVVEQLQRERERNVKDRFHCRAIMVKDITNYCELLSELKKISDIRVVKSSEIFSSGDTMPQYENLINSRYDTEWVILTGVSEYLRLFSKKEAEDGLFSALWRHKAPGTSTGRIIIPLWGCEPQWFDATLNLVGDSRQTDYFFDCTDSEAPDQKLDIVIFSGIFEGYINKIRSSTGLLFTGLKDYFEYWENPSPNNTHLFLLTNRFRSIVPVSGNVNLHVVKDMLAFIKENISGSGMLNRDNCSEDMQTILFDHALKNESIDYALLSILNLSKFVDTDVMSRWASLSDAERKFIKLWLLLHPKDTYLNHCFFIAQSIESVPDVICHEIFCVRLDRPEWVGEFKALARAMTMKPDQEYLNEVDAIADFSTRVEFLTGATRNEKIYLLHMMGKWMNTDIKDALADKTVPQIYPELSAYLRCDLDSLNGELGDYLSTYKTHKLENSLPVDEEAYFSGVKTDAYDYRYAVLSEYINENTIILWIDALGVEWLSLLQLSISRQCNATITKIAVAQATLPSETCFNEQWKHMDVPYDKLDRLDKLAHKGVIDEPDYYSCIEAQLSFVASSVPHRINELLKKHHRVIITGDHGTSRLAARFFHVREGILAPKDSLVHSHGRYCETSSANQLEIPGCRIVPGQDGIKYVVFMNYDHFKQSGYAAGGDDENAKYGEIHGGATPEEMLVPVIVVDSNEQISLIGTWQDTDVKITNKKVRLTINFNEVVSNLSMSIAGHVGVAVKSNEGTSWTTTFEKLSPGTHSVDVVADGNILKMPEITIKPALGGGIGDLP